MTVIVFGLVVAGVGGVGVWMWSRRRRENSVLPPEESGTELRGGRRRRED